MEMPSNNCVNSGEDSLSQSRAKRVVRANGNKRKADQTGDPSKYPQGYFRAKPCRVCSAEFSPKSPSELYCTQQCADEASFDRYLNRTYGITAADYRRMHASQCGKCAICGGEGFTMKDTHKVLLVVDHCHATGRVRGLLCHNCNRALGLLQDSEQSLRRAIDYLKV